MKKYPYFKSGDEEIKHCMVLTNDINRVLLSANEPVSWEGELQL